MDKKNEKNVLNSITKQIIKAAIDIHRILGPGLLETAYEKYMVNGIKRLVNDY